ncbi:phenylalanine--tRNA ligase subunit alpha [Candidatus Acetothermia bacterium]|jgi:phenylalanyl-tRNA synthetase alpha chain|nr:phenylalanine--tRNA ligase subunit alpha [Candidatus Acetothermia bacterium]MCI2427877.1 phenylalanine--tRNA ligase subunit alpha [Candidatus Acetothermia bacterium]MCI2428938.1 phenylalanine--tRNA ligase subunit alpha [Candidatus Acetothermia bacterium]
MVTLKDLRREIAVIAVLVEEQIPQINSATRCEELRVQLLGRKGKVAQLFKLLGELSPQERPIAGQLLNELKEKVTAALAGRVTVLGSVAERSDFTTEWIDITLPGTYHPYGHFHPLSQVQQKIEEIFLRMGFTVVAGPEIETEYYNFEALNIPVHHPAREEWDSFYIDETHLLRAHTSPVQIRIMEEKKPPLRIICPGRCYRRDNQDATHSPVFHQVEMLWVEKDLSLANLKYIIELFVKEFFGERYQMRFLADFFPFTEPSIQVHIRSPHSTEWLEIMGAGMVDPIVFQKVGYDPEQVTGFAFGLGIERMAMLRYKIDDIRLFFQNDLRFLHQF